MNLEDLAKRTIDEVNQQINEQKRQQDILKEQEIKQSDFKTPEFVVEELNINQEEKTQEEQEEIKEHIQMAHLEEELKISHLNSFDDQKEEIKEDKNNIEIFAENRQEVVKEDNVNEDIFLNNIKERILVLFEGLNNTKKEALEQRLELTTNFLEFLLANIEDKLKK